MPESLFFSFLLNTIDYRIFSEFSQYNIVIFSE
nr:MAG TPA: hypothetical protein [Caudoviricetes sp.]